MTFLEFCKSLEETPVGLAIRESPTLFPMLESIHVVALTLVVGTIAIIDLRLLDVASRNQAISRLTAQVLPWTWIGFAVAFVSGGLLFLSRASSYVVNTPFQLKMAMLVAAGFNMLMFHLVTYRSVQNWDLGSPTPIAAKIAGGLSLALWILIIGLGRWIGFY